MKKILIILYIVIFINNSSVFADLYSYVNLDDGAYKWEIEKENDRFWTLDALNIYWDELKGKKYILYVPNSGHGLEDITRVFNNITSFFLMTSGQIKFPTLKWNLKDTENKTIMYIKPEDVKPTIVQVWVAKSTTKDFREAKWEKFPISKSKDGLYKFEIDKPQDGYIAMFGEAIYDMQKGKNFFLSTQVLIRKKEM